MILSATLVIIAVTVILHFVTESNVELKAKMLFNAYQIKHRKEWWRWITHAFIHANMNHLLINMFVLWMFGSDVEVRMNSLFDNGLMYFLLLYFGGIIVSSVPAFLKHQNNPGYNALGASGATSSMLFAYILIWPTSKFYGFVPAFIFGVLYLWYENSQGKKGGTGIAHDAHFWGAVFGFGGLLALKPGLLGGFIDQISGMLQSIGG